MQPRAALAASQLALSRESALVLLGPRQVGKTTLALQLGATRPSLYLDLEAQADLEKLHDAAGYLRQHSDKLVILDEMHRLPTLFATLRGLIDEGRRTGQPHGRFLLLGSASLDLMRQSETLAGRVEYLELGGLHALEMQPDTLNRLWLRGGFPRSTLANDDNESFARRQNLIRSYLEREVPLFGPRVPAETLRRLWTMLAHHQGALLNASQLASSLAVSSPTLARYIDLLVDLLLVRRLPPFHINEGKRLVKSPKTYIRDSGLLHALLGLSTLDALLGHPVCGASWEGFVIENLLAVVPRHCKASFYRTARGAEMDLVLEFGGNAGVWAIEIKRGTVPTTKRGFSEALQDIQPDKAFIVYAGTERYRRNETVEVIGLRELMEEIIGKTAQSRIPSTP